jgi:hypothetical protein
MIAAHKESVGLARDNSPSGSESKLIGDQDAGAAISRKTHTSVDFSSIITSSLHQGIETHQRFMRKITELRSGFLESFLVSSSCILVGILRSLSFNLSLYLGII